MTVELGKKIRGAPPERDAIHLAVIPVVASEPLDPGQHVGIFPPKARDGVFVGVCDPKVGIVDPYLTERVLCWETFWLCLYPNTVTGMRHHWEHSAFDKCNYSADVIKQSQAWMETFATMHHEWPNYPHDVDGPPRQFTANELIEHAKRFLEVGYFAYSQKGSDSLRDFGAPSEFWKHFEILTGIEVPDSEKDRMPFSCSC